MVNKIITIVLLCIMSVAPAVAQHSGKSARMRAELQEFKIKYLIQEIDLPADKHADFTIIYTQFDHDRESLFDDMGTRFKAFKNKEGHSDAEYSGMAEAMAVFKYREGDLEKSCFQQLKTLLTPKQLYLLKHAEHKFHRKIMDMQRKGKKSKAKARKK